VDSPYIVDLFCKRALQNEYFFFKLWSCLPKSKMKSLLRLWSQFCKRALQNIVGLFCKKQTPKQTPTNPRVQSRPAMFALPHNDIVGLFCRTDTNKTSFAKQTPAKPLLQNRHQQNVLCSTDLIFWSHTWYCRALLQYRRQQSLFCKTDTNRIACAKQPLYICHIHDIVGLFCSTDTNNPSFAKQTPTKLLVQNSPYMFVTYMIL